MKAWLIDTLGPGISQLRLTDVADPVPGPGEVLLGVAFAALNPADRYLSEGLYPVHPSLPHILGREGAGTLEALGPGVEGLRVGQSVLLLRGEAGVSRPGTFAQRVAVPAECLVELPAGWTAPQAAGAPVAYLAAYQALTQWRDPPLPPMPVVLITGATGGVGIAAVELAKAMGAIVLGLTRSEAKAAKLLELGAHAVFNITTPTWPKQVRHYLDSTHNARRVDLVIDNVGGTLLPEVIGTLGMNGRVSVVGRLAGPTPNFNSSTLLFRRIRLGGVAIATWTAAETRAAWAQLLELLARTDARPVIDSVFAFEDLPAAFRRLAEGPLGKVVLAVAGKP